MVSSVSTDGCQPSSIDALVWRVHRGDTLALHELRRVVKGGVQFMVARKLGPGPLAERVAGLALDAALKALTDGRVPVPAAFSGYLRAVIQEGIAEAVRHMVRTKKGEDIVEACLSPREVLERDARRVRCERILGGLPDMEREVLTRYYVREQTPEQICRQMGISGDRFRHLKASARAKFVDEGLRKTATTATVQFRQARAACAS